MYMHIYIYIYGHVFPLPRSGDISHQSMLYNHFTILSTYCSFNYSVHLLFGIARSSDISHHMALSHARMTAVYANLSSRSPLTCWVALLV